MSRRKRRRRTNEKPEILPQKSALGASSSFTSQFEINQQINWGKYVVLVKEAASSIKWFINCPNHPCQVFHLLLITPTMFICFTDDKWLWADQKSNDEYAAYCDIRKNFDTNEYLNIFIWKFLTQTNIRIYLYQNLATNEYPNIFIFQKVETN